MKVRLDQLLVQRGLCETRARAQARILAGDVLVEGHPVTKAGHGVPEDPDAIAAVLRILAGPWLRDPPR